MNLAEGADENQTFTEEQAVVKAINITDLDSGRVTQFMRWNLFCLLKTHKPFPVDLLIVILWDY